MSCRQHRPKYFLLRQDQAGCTSLAAWRKIQPLAGISIPAASTSRHPLRLDPPCGVFAPVATGATMAPMSIDLSRGGPTRSVSMRSRISRWRRGNAFLHQQPGAAQHTCPWLNQMPRPSFDRTSRSASSKMTKGDCRPAQGKVFVTLRRRGSDGRPTSVDPVNAICRRPHASPEPPVEPSPVTIFTTPRQTNLRADFSKG